MVPKFFKYIGIEIGFLVGLFLVGLGFSRVAGGIDSDALRLGSVFFIASLGPLSILLTLIFLGEIIIDKFHPNLQQKTFLARLAKYLSWVAILSLLGYGPHPLPSNLISGIFFGITSSLALAGFISASLAIILGIVVFRKTHEAFGLESVFIGILALICSAVFLFATGGSGSVCVNHNGCSSFDGALPATCAPYFPGFPVGVCIPGPGLS